MIRKWDPVRVWAVGLLVLVASILSYGIALLNQGIDQSQQVSEQNTRFLSNFSDYMRCLVVTDEVKYDELGKAAYYDFCEELLFRGTGLRP